MDPVTLYNPVDGEPVEVTVPVERVRLTAAGYRPDKPFDPNEHKVDEVQQHLTENPDDAARVRTVEKAGKNRATVTGEPTTAGDNVPS